MILLYLVIYINVLDHEEVVTVLKLTERINADSMTPLDLDIISINKLIKGSQEKMSDVVW